MGSEQKDTDVYILCKHLPAMKRYLDLDVISTYLISEGCITMSDRPLLEVSVLQSRDKAVQNLVKLVQRGGQKGLLAFFTSLRRSTTEEDPQPGHKELLRILEEEEQRKSSAASVDVLESISSDRKPLLPQTSTSSVPSSNLDVEQVAAYLNTADPTPEPEAGDTVTDFVGASRLSGPLQDDPDPEEPLLSQQLLEAEINADRGIHARAAETRTDEPVAAQPAASSTLHSEHSRTSPPHSWKPFILGMVCSGLLAAGITLLTISIRGFQGLERCGLGDSGSINAYIFMSGFLCLAPAVVPILIVVWLISKEYKWHRFVRKVIGGLICVYLACCAFVAVGQLIFSFYVSRYAYGEFENWVENKTVCSDAIFVSSFITLTVFYILVLAGLIILVILGIYRHRRAVRDRIITYIFASAPRYIIPAQ